MKEETLDRSQKTIAHHHASLSLSVLSLSFLLIFRRPAQRRGAAEAHPAAARERDGAQGTKVTARIERKEAADDDLFLSRPLLSPSLFSQTPDERRETLSKTTFPIPATTTGARVPGTRRRRLQAHRPGARQAGARRGGPGSADAPRLHRGRAVAARGGREEDRRRRGRVPGAVRGAAAAGDQGEHGGCGCGRGWWRR